MSFDLKILDNLINQLIQNVNKNKIPPKINLCFDTGVFNGGYALGSILYLKTLEKNNLTKVDKISGAGVGSIIGLIYLLDSDKIDYNKIFKQICMFFKKKLHFSILKKIIKKIVYSHFKDDNMDLINDRLFINYHDMKYYKNILVSNFKNRKHLIKCLISSCHIPYLFNSNCKYKNRYIDGLMCHVFDDNIPNLFVRLITFKKIFRCINIKYETNIYNRILNGLTDANNFFVEGSSDMFYYIENGWIYKLELIIRQIIIFIFIYFYKYVKLFYDNVLYEDIKNEIINTII